MKTRGSRCPTKVPPWGTGVVLAVLAGLLWHPTAWGALRDSLLAQVSGERAYRHVVVLSRTIGPHPAGTPADKASGDYIASLLARWGYAVEWQAFTFPYFAVRRVALTVPSAPALQFHPQVMRYSPSAPAGGISAPLVAAGTGRPEDFARVDARGKVALVRRGGLTFREKAENAASAGAVALLVYNSRPGPFAGTLGRAARIPVLALPAEEGATLLGLLHSGPVSVRLDVETEQEDRTTWNIVGTKRGTREPHRVLVVGAHRDTVEGAPGANDNSSGVATALEVAEVLRSAPLPVTVQFVFFGAEEEGLFGSDYFVRHAGPDPIVGMVNLDMEGVGSRLVVARFRGSEALVQLAARVAASLGIRVQVAQEGASDHVNFERAGAPVVFIFRPDDPDYDTPRDTVDRVDPALLETSARLALAVVLEVAGHGP